MPSSRWYERHVTTIDRFRWAVEISRRTYASSFDRLFPFPFSRGDGDSTANKTRNNPLFEAASIPLAKLILQPRISRASGSSRRKSPFAPAGLTPLSRLSRATAERGRYKDRGKERQRVREAQWGVARKLGGPTCCWQRGSSHDAAINTLHHLQLTFTG